MTKQTKIAIKQRPLSGTAPLRADERSEDTRGGAVPDNGRAETSVGQSNETVERPRRRTFTAEYKNQILGAVDTCESGTIGTLLRREGLYSSHLAEWRRERDAGGLAALAPKRRGPTLCVGAAEQKEIEKLKKNVAALEHRLHQAQVIIEFQKKLHDVLGIPLGSPPEIEDPSRSNSSTRLRR